MSAAALAQGPRTVADRQPEPRRDRLVGRRPVREERARVPAQDLEVSRHGDIVGSGRCFRRRLAGFLCIAAGGLLLGIGSVMNWAVIGFAGSTALDSPIKGTDVREGRATL